MRGRLVSRFVLLVLDVALTASPVRVRSAEASGPSMAQHSVADSSAAASAHARFRSWRVRNGLLFTDMTPSFRTTGRSCLPQTWNRDGS
jgi:hypothetical protein